MVRGKLKNVATAQYDFAELRRNDTFVYVDKTDMLARLAMKDLDAIYFISRPRRFGKSLMLSTLKCAYAKQAWQNQSNERFRPCKQSANMVGLNSKLVSRNGLVLLIPPTKEMVSETIRLRIRLCRLCRLLTAIGVLW